GRRTGGGRTAKRKGGLTERKTPQIAGPEIVATCVVTEEAATARGSISVGTTAGSSAWLVVASKARPAPRQNTAARMNSLLIAPVKDPYASAAAARPSTLWQSCRISRRS